jgi:hypothetical protein
VRYIQVSIHQRNPIHHENIVIQVPDVVQVIFDKTQQQIFFYFLKLKKKIISFSYKLNNFILTTRLCECWHTCRLILMFGTHYLLPKITKNELVGH